jgi:hypothetical protein
VSVAARIYLRHEQRHVTEDGVERAVDLLRGIASVGGLSPSTPRGCPGR